MAKFRTAVSFDEEVAAQIDAVAEKWYSDRSSALQRIFLEWKELTGQTAPSEQPRTVTVNGVTYVQQEMPEAA